MSMNISPPLTQTLHVMMSIMSMNISPPLTQTLHVMMSNEYEHLTTTNTNTACHDE